MGARTGISVVTTRRAIACTATAAGAFVIGSWPDAVAGASNRLAFTATTSGSGGVLLALGGAVLVLGIIGFAVFTWSRRKRRPGPCAEQRAALELAERSVRYWEAAKAHLEAVDNTRTSSGEVAEDPSSHASLVAKAADGLRAALQQRDQCQLDLIHCMASGVPAVPVIPTPTTASQPFFIPGTDESSPDSTTSG